MNSKVDIARDENYNEVGYTLLNLHILFLAVQMFVS